jgi:hypothetical protein
MKEPEPSIEVKYCSGYIAGESITVINWVFFDERSLMMREAEVELKEKVYFSHALRKTVCERILVGLRG